MKKDRLNLLLVNASARRNGSTTRRLAQELVKGLRESGVDLRLTERDLADGAPFVDEAWIGANFTAPEMRTAEQSATLAYSDELVAELKAADLVVIAAPIYNFSIPAALKAWIDQVARARVTFQYTDRGPVGLLNGKRAVVIAASGGTEAGSDIDFATGYLRHILGFLGITDVAFVLSDRQMADAAVSEAHAQEGLARALADLRRMAKAA